MRSKHETLAKGAWIVTHYACAPGPRLLHSNHSSHTRICWVLRNGVDNESQSESRKLLPPSGDEWDTHGSQRVMGPTGVGKTTFINIASGSHLRVGHTLVSATESVESSVEFSLDGNWIQLVDTPGFDDTTKSNAEILKIIADFLSSSYRKKHMLHGIIYLHRISDNRMGGTAMRNFKMFRQLCGQGALSNSVIVLNMWNEVSSEVREAREKELCTKEIFFKPVLDAGAQMAHHDNSTGSAHDILRLLTGRGRVPKPLLIQREMVDDGKLVRDTSAGIELLGDLAAAERKHSKQLEEMQKDMEEAIRKKDLEEQTELEDARRRLDELRSRLTQEQKSIHTHGEPASPPDEQFRPKAHEKLMKMLQSVKQSIGVLQIWARMRPVP
ncbi:uncharacterized protein FIBRA_06005 [Fibroporia radiculosa]|uniref:G domain-containing protein n=1 Tax=Fibroporia radiculosa TaxID=599839 RepID=J4IB12_9APHY|nr:uncharacterized protein FIBRA_06005 [Fibroporia radiculosa]CCM03856.1 predicted protein [Fibroporia radiculosa]